MEESIFDEEKIVVRQLYLKKIGKYCECGCGRHIFPKPHSDMSKKKYFNKACQMRVYRQKHATKSKNFLISNINIKAKTITVYLGATRETFVITPQYVELYNFLVKIERFRNLSIPLNEVITT